jgi:ABC-type multidrug transport system fused ATPase/permease subunit
MASNSAAAKGTSDANGWRGRWRYLPRLLRLLWELGPREVTLIGTLAAGSGVVPVLRVATLLRLVNDAVAAAVGKAPWAVAASWLALLILLNTVAALADLAGQWLGADMQERLKARAQERLLAKAARIPLATFEQPAFFDRLHRAQEGVEERLLSTMESLFPLPGYLVTALGLLLYVGSVSAVFPVLLLGGIFPSYLIGRFFNQQRFHLARQHTASERKLGYLFRLLTGRETAAEIRLFGLQDYLTEKRRDLFARLRGERLELARAQAIGYTLPIAWEQITYGAVVLGVVALIVGGRLTVGAYAAYLEAAERFRDAVLMLLVRVNGVDDNLRYVRDLFDHLDEADEEEPSEEEPSPEEGCPPLAPPVSVRFENVTFSYPGRDRPVLTGVSFTLHPGERIALVGENGAGKTTLAKLLLGLYAPTGGRILVNGTDLRQAAPLGWWRAQTSAVFQDFVRYALTVRENIGFGDIARLDDAEAIRATASRSGAAAIAERLPAGYETPLGKAYDEAAQDLSLGQWQKVAIARATLRDAAAVLVLDEPTAALDARAEVDVYRQFRDLAQGKSVLFISHRLGSARLADRILFLEDGRITAEGSHAALMAAHGRYAEMYSLQAAWYR